MERAGRLPLQIRLTSLVLIAVIYGCARTAPELPPDYILNMESPKALLSQVPPLIRGMTCDEINQDLTNLSMHDSQLEAEIQGNRGKNQTAGYIAGVLFFPAILAVDNDKSTKSLLDQNQKHRDHLIFAQKAKGCSPIK